MGILTGLQNQVTGRGEKFCFVMPGEGTCGRDGVSFLGKEIHRETQVKENEALLLNRDKRLSSWHK